MALTCDINIQALKLLDKSTFFGHPIGIVIGKNAILGENCRIEQNVTIGARYPNEGLPCIGDNVFIGANALLLGDILIGDNVKIGAGSIILTDVPSNRTVVGLVKQSL